MVIRPLDFLKQCYTAEDGQAVFERVHQAFKSGESVTVVFSGVDAVPSSFVNAAFIQLLEHYSYEDIKKRLTFSHSTKQINEMLLKRFDFEAKRVSQKLGR